MIKNETSLSMAEIKEYVEKNQERNADIIAFIKKFTKMKSENAKKIREEIQKLDLMKIKDEHIVKIIDLFPENKEDLNKIFTDISLNEDETTKVLETIKQFK
ncbi:MAG: hypothetical protein KJ646_03730 [Nanoarchaeota archaeon]|nr:hypothetical protein [Nanoarchaeota archaeon]